MYACEHRNNQRNLNFTQIFCQNIITKVQQNWKSDSTPRTICKGKMRSLETKLKTLR